SGEKSGADCGVLQGAARAGMRAIEAKERLLDSSEQQDEVVQCARGEKHGPNFGEGDGGVVRGERAQRGKPKRGGENAAGPRVRARDCCEHGGETSNDDAAEEI